MNVLPPLSRRAAALALLGALFTLPMPALAGGVTAHGEDLPQLPVSVSVAQVAGKPVVDEGWIDAQLAQAERLFGDAGIHFRKVEIRSLSDRFAHLGTRADRDALAPTARRGAINVMIVDTLRDVDDPKLFRMGVHWRPIKSPKEHYVIVAASAMPTTMAHEIGHFFGNGHTKIQNNLMSYDRVGDAISLTDGQKKTSVSFCRLYLRIKEIDPGLAPPAIAPPPVVGPAALGGG
ncbi:MAG: hypothetical protein U0359_10400 [Byssovorax sp.]